MKYDFLLLSGLMLIPGTVVFAFRADLRRVILTMGLCSLPFALTEFLFYPSYWEPVFLFDLARRIGFGIEDFLFVFGLAAFTSTGYPFFFRRVYVSIGETSFKLVSARIATLIGAALLLTAVLAILGVPIIWGCVLIMLGISAVVCLYRRDLILPSLLGGTISVVVYGTVCLILAAIVPDVFHLSWHAERFSNIYIFDIPLEELTYSGSAGITATVFYPFVFSMAFDRLKAQERTRLPFEKRGRK